jgi:hypothetical protein
MLTGILIIAFSLALLVYWFRYSCSLLLQSAREAVPTADDTRFHVAEVQQQLPAAADLTPLRQSLERDYTMLVYLVEHAAGLQLSSIEDRLLVLDYRIMRCWYAVARVVAPQQARAALSEMATVVGILAGKMERAGVHGKI